MIEDGNDAKPVEIRDLRVKDKFVMDDKFLNGYAREVGPMGSTVYMSLCRHADKDQTCWPSINKIAEELNISRFSVMRGLKNLKKRRIIGIIRIGKTCTNRYVLYDRKCWRHYKEKESDVAISNFTQVGGDVAISNISSAPQQHHQCATATSKKGNTSKETQVRIPAPKQTVADFNWPEYLEKMKKDPNRAIQIIALYVEYKQEKIANSKIINGIIKRNVRVANDLAGYTNGQICRTMDYLTHDPNAQFLRGHWNLETVFKYILDIKDTKSQSSWDFSHKRATV